MAPVTRCTLVVALLWAVAAGAVPVPVANGDFEAGMEGWNVIRPEGFSHGEVSIAAEGAHGGAGCARIANAPEGEKVLLGLTNSAHIALPDDCRTFSLSVWYKSVTVPEMIELRVASTDKAGRALSPWEEHGWRFFRPNLDAGVGEWYRYQVDFAAHPDWGGIALTFWVRGAGAEVLVDDIALEAVDPRDWMVAQSGGCLPGPSPGVSLWTEGPLRKVYPDEIAPEREVDGLELAAAGGEYETAQVCLRADRDLRGLSFSFSAPAGPVTLGQEIMAANFVGLVDIAYPTSGRGRSGPTPDPLLTETSLDIPAGETRSLWVTVHVPPGTPAGDYLCRMALAAEGLAVEVPIKLHVYGFDLPPRPTLTTIARIWQQHEGYEHLFLQALRDHRCSGSSYVGGLSVSVQNGKIVVDAGKLPAAVQSKLTAYDFHVFNAPSVFLGDAGGFYAKDGKWNGFELLSPQFDEAFMSYCRQVAAAFRSAGVMQDAIWQVWDEPQNDEMTANCIHIARLVKEAAPDARIYLTAGVTDSLLDLVDIWCLPWPSCYSEQQAELAREHGAELWAYDNSLYSMDVPDSSLLMRHFPWRLKRYGIKGVEWWAVSQWKSDPWTVANQYAPQNGGGFFLYPTPDRTGAPIGSIRFAMYRAGVEDYDLLSLLQERQDGALAGLGVEDERLGGARQVQELVSRVALSPALVSDDATVADRLRRQVAERIEFLQADPPAAVGTVRQGAGRLLLVAAGSAQVTIDGEVVEGPVAEKHLPEGQAATVEVLGGDARKTVTVR